MSAETQSKGSPHRNGENDDLQCKKEESQEETISRNTNYAASQPIEYENQSLTSNNSIPSNTQSQSYDMGDEIQIEDGNSIDQHIPVTIDTNYVNHGIKSTSSTQLVSLVTPNSESNALVYETSHKDENFPINEIKLSKPQQKSIHCLQSQTSNSSSQSIPTHLLLSSSCGIAPQTIAINWCKIDGNARNRLDSEGFMKKMLKSADSSLHEYIQKMGANEIGEIANTLDMASSIDVWLIWKMETMTVCGFSCCNLINKQKNM